MNREVIKSKKIVVLANSRKPPGRCIAGIEINNDGSLGNWVRPWDVTSANGGLSLENLKSQNDVEITNLAVDESTTNDVLYGLKPNYTYVEDRKLNKMYPYPLDKNGRVEPLKILKNIINDKYDS